MWNLGPRGFASLSGGVELSAWPFFPGRAGLPYFRCRMHTFLAIVLIAPGTQHLALNVSCKCDWFYMYYEIYFKTKDKNRWKFCPRYYILINIGLSEVVQIWTRVQKYIEEFLISNIAPMPVLILTWRVYLLSNKEQNKTLWSILQFFLRCVSLMVTYSFFVYN